MYKTVGQLNEAKEKAVNQINTALKPFNFIQVLVVCSKSKTIIKRFHHFSGVIKGGYTDNPRYTVARISDRALIEGINKANGTTY